MDSARTSPLRMRCRHRSRSFGRPSRSFNAGSRIVRAPVAALPGSRRFRPVHANNLRLGAAPPLCQNPRVRLYTRYKPERRKRHPIRSLGPLVILSLAVIWWLQWEPRKKEEPGALLKSARQPASATPTGATNKSSTLQASLPASKWRLGPALTNLATRSTFAQPPADAGGFVARPVRSVFEAQLALARLGISPGTLDGVVGSRTRAALRAYQQAERLPATGELDAATKSRLLLTTPPYASYVVTTNDLARLRPLGNTWLAKSRQDRLDYETPLELVAEKSRAHADLIRQLNPALNWTNLGAGTTVRVPNVEFQTPRGRAAFVRIRLADRVLQVFDESTNLVAHFPCSVARQIEKRPVGELRVATMAPDPVYTFDPENFPDSPEARELKRKLVLPPGPNNPVGTAWIGLDRPGYGIHGTPRPEAVGRAESLGCFRLANWNAEHLAQLVTVGTPVIVEP